MKLLCICVLLVVTLGITSAKSNLSRRGLAEFKKVLTNRGQLLSHNAVKRDDTGNGCDELVTPCFDAFWTSMDGAKKSTSTTVQQCSDIADTFVQCLDAKVQDGSLCQSCDKAGQGIVFGAKLGVAKFKDVLCAPFGNGGKGCKKEVMDCVGYCLKERIGGGDNGMCTDCVDDLKKDLKSNNLGKCPLLKFLKTIQITDDVMWALMEAYMTGCTKEDLQSCLTGFDNVDCSSATAVEENQTQESACLKKLAKDNDDCEALGRLPVMFEKNHDLIVKMGQQMCTVMQTVKNTCGDKKKRLLELLRRFLEE